MSIKKLNSRHLAMMRDLVVEGLRPGEVCEKYGFTDSRLSVLRSSALWQEQERLMQEQALSNSIIRINALREKAIDALDTCVQSWDEKVKLASARDILDRTGIKAGQELDLKTSGDIHLYVPKNWNNQEQPLEEE